MTEDRAGASPIPRLPVLRTLSRTGLVWLRGAPTFALLSAVVHVPWFLWWKRSLEEPSSEWLVQAALIAGQFLSMVVAAGPITAAAYRDLRGWPSSVWWCAGVGVSRTPRVLALGAILALRIARYVTPLLLLWLLVGDPYFVWVDVTVAPLAVVGVVVFAQSALCIPAAVLEARPVPDALSRGILLTRGNRWRITGTLLVVLVIEMLVIGLIARWVEPLGFLAVLWVAVLAPWWAIVTCVVFHDLRVAREGEPRDFLARVFD